METYEDPLNDPNCDPALALITAFMQEGGRRQVDPFDGLRGSG
jgi:hypothetical protein